MTDRTFHIIAVSLMIAGIAVGGVSWVLDGTPFWITAGVAAALVIAGLAVAGRIGRGEKQEGAGKK
jgi:alkylation response protein AidB-like acyl-CoA dehydrogenase